jgi:morphogenetic protein associated with SpoVID
MRKLPPEKQHELRERWLQRQQEYPSAQQQGRPGYAPQQYAPQQYAPQQYAPPGYPAADQQRRYGEPPQSRSSDGRGERRSREESQQGPRR